MARWASYPNQYYPSFVDYRDWEDATPEQRRVWNCALDIVFSRPSREEVSVAQPTSPLHPNTNNS